MLLQVAAGTRLREMTADVKHDINRIGGGRRKQNASSGQWIDGSHCNSFHDVQGSNGNQQ